MIKKTLAIIGAGVMGKALATRLLDAHIVAADALILTNIVPSFLKEFQDKGVHITVDNRDAVAKADIVVFAVKPRDMQSVLYGVKDLVKPGQLIISIAAGVTIASIQQVLVDSPIIRVMPNIAAKVGQSMSVWVKNTIVSKEHVDFAEEIFTSIGKTIAVDRETLIDAATAISGSGPAYFFYLTELLQKAAIDVGFSEQQATILAMQTCIGAGELLKESRENAQQLREEVTSKGGTTEAALQKLQQESFATIFFAAVSAAYEKAKQLRGEDT